MAIESIARRFSNMAPNVSNTDISGQNFPNIFGGGGGGGVGKIITCSLKRL